MYRTFFAIFLAQVAVGLVLIKLGVLTMPVVEGAGVLLIVAGGWLIITGIQVYRNLTKEIEDADV